MLNNLARFFIAFAILYSIAACSGGKPIADGDKNGKRTVRNAYDPDEVVGPEPAKKAQDDKDTKDEKGSKDKKDEKDAKDKKGSKDDSEDRSDEIKIGDPDEENAADDDKLDKKESSDKKEKTDIVPDSKKISVASALEDTGEVEGIKLSKKVLSDIYSARDHRSIWFDGKKPNANYDKAVKFISEADENGLNRRYFNVEPIRKRVATEDQKDDFVAKTDLLITQLVTDMIQQIGNGHTISDSLKIQTYFTRPVRVENPARAFSEFLNSDDPEKLIEKYSPKNPQYGLLKKALKAYIAKAGDNRTLTPIVYSKDLTGGEKSHIIPDVRNRLGVRRMINPGVDADLYDKALVEKVAEFQKKFKQKQTGIINKQFIEALNGYDIDSISRIKANMERYRWLKDDLEPTRVMVNLADFKMSVYKDNKLDFDMNVIAGHEERKTPIMSTTMYQFVMNPYWTPPKAYFFRNMLPLLKGDPHYIKDQNFDLLRLEKKGWVNIDQSDVDWNKLTPDNYNIMMRERPGNLNVLGPVKFFIKNPYDIFIHFTSEPWLFTNKNRGYSSGCIRIEDPVKFVKFLREETGVEISEEEFMKLFNAYQSRDGIALPQKKEYNDKYFKFKKPLPTYTVYFSAIADENGNITFTDDIYDLDFDQAKDLGL